MNIYLDRNLIRWTNKWRGQMVFRMDRCIDRYCFTQIDRKIFCQIDEKIFGSIDKKKYLQIDLLINLDKEVVKQMNSWNGQMGIGMDRQYTAWIYKYIDRQIEVQVNENILIDRYIN